MLAFRNLRASHLDTFVPSLLLARTRPHQPVLCLLLSYENVILALSNVLDGNSRLVEIGRISRGENVLQLHQHIASCLGFIQFRNSSFEINLDRTVLHALIIGML